jgi:SpoVK/Ycf46/Vps4 family AAA+-type ATPase
MRIEWKTIPKKCRSDKKDFPTGTVIFTGRQGAGKTLSATHYLTKLKQSYPDLYIFSNISLKIANKVITSAEVQKYILWVHPKDAPIAFFLDEIQTVLYNSKNATSLEVFKSICQQRKAKKTIIGTAQEFLDIDIKYRRQLNSLVECSNFKKLQFERWVDPETLRLDPQSNKYVGDTSMFNIWKRHDEAFDIYDTYEIVNSVMQIDNNLRPADASASMVANINIKRGK